MAAIGPNAASVGNLAITKSRLDGNTKGLAASQNSSLKQDLVLTITNSPIFNLDGIDLSFDYQRDETVATVFQRGAFVMALDGMNIKYRVNNGTGGSTTVTSPSYLIPDDDTFRTYRFRYDPVTGIGILSQNGGELWRNTTATPGQPLYWEGDGNIVIGTAMDGSGRGNALLDNLRIVAVPAAAALPVELVTFVTTVVNGQVVLDWKTSAEVNNEKFVVERKTDHFAWEAIATVPGSGDSQGVRTYTLTDDAPPAGRSYYRLRQVDYGGASVYSDIRTVDVAGTGDGLSAYPNPTRDQVTLEGLSPNAGIRVYDMSGHDVTDRVSISQAGGKKWNLDLSDLVSGAYRVIQAKSTIMVYRR